MYLDTHDDAYMEMLSQPPLLGNTLDPERYPYVYDEYILQRGVCRPAICRSSNEHSKRRLVTFGLLVAIADCGLAGLRAQIEQKLRDREQSRRKSSSHANAACSGIAEPAGAEGCAPHAQAQSGAVMTVHVGHAS